MTELFVLDRLAGKALKKMQKEDLQVIRDRVATNLNKNTRLSSYSVKADEFLANAKLQIEETINIMGAERAVRPLSIQIAGMPR